MWNILTFKVGTFEEISCRELMQGLVPDSIDAHTGNRLPVKLRRIPGGRGWWGDYLTTVWV